MSVLGCSAGELGNVLRSLGFRADRRLVTPAGPATETIAASETTADAPPASGRASACRKPAAPAEAAPLVQAAEIPLPGEVASAVAGSEPVSPPTAAASEATTEPAVAQAEEKWEEIWRPRRRGRAFEPARPAQGKDAAAPPAEERQPEPTRPRQAATRAWWLPQQACRAARRRQAPRGRWWFQTSRRWWRPRSATRAAAGRNAAKIAVRARNYRPAPSAKAGFDLDPPFAALSSLKASLGKRTQD